MKTGIRAARQQFTRSISFCFVISLTVYTMIAVQGISHAHAEDNSEQEIYALIDKYAEARDTKNEALLESILTTNIDQLSSAGKWRIGSAEAMSYMMKSSTSNLGDRTITIEKVRFLNPENAIVDSIYKIEMPDGKAVELWSTFIVLNVEGQWKITAIRNMLPRKS